MTPQLIAAIARLDDNHVDYRDRVNCATVPGRYERANAESDVALVLDELRRLQGAEHNRLMDEAEAAGIQDAKGEAFFNDRA